MEMDNVDEQNPIFHMEILPMSMNKVDFPTGLQYVDEQNGIFRLEIV